MTTFGERLSKLMKKKGISGQELANRFGVNRSTVSRWRKGTFEPDMETIKELAKIFNVTVDYLLGHDEKEEKKDNNIIDILEEIKKRPYYIDPKTGRIRQIPERKARIIADIIEDFLKEEGKLPEDNEDCRNSM